MTESADDVELQMIGTVTENTNDTFQRSPPTSTQTTTQTTTTPTPTTSTPTPTPTPTPIATQTQSTTEWMNGQPMTPRTKKSIAIQHSGWDEKGVQVDPSELFLDPNQSRVANHDDDIQKNNNEPTIIAFVNFNSGGKMGASIAGGLKKLLGDDHVFNLAEGGPVPGLKKYRDVKNLRIAVCGGDGTVNWLLSVIHALEIRPPPAVAIIPLGTGNDTARAFGWGKKFPGMRGIKKIIEAMKIAEPVPYDRFHLAISHPREVSDKFLKSLPPSLRLMEYYPIFYDERHIYETEKTHNDDKGERVLTPRQIQANVEDEKKITTTTSTLADAPSPSSAPPAPPEAHGTHVGHSPKKEASAVQMAQSKRQERENISHLKILGGQWNNYLSFGVDAQIIYDFHHMRETHRELFCCRCCNMTWMGWFGTANCCCCQAKPFDVEIEIPNPKTGIWEKIPLPRGLEAIIFLNLQTYAGGRRIWGKGKSGKNEYNGVEPSLNDGLIEIIGVSSSMHLGRMVSECSRGIRIAQASEIKFTSKNTVYVQLDGEPWEDEPCTYHIRRIDQSMMLKNTKVKI